MQFKELFTFILTSGTFALNQSHATQQIKTFDGPYLGVGAAYLTATSQFDQNLTTAEIQSNLRMAGQAPQASLFAGYGCQISSPLYLGLEGKVSHTNYQGKYTSDNTKNRSLNFEIKDSYSVLGKLGWNVQNVALIYTKAGFCNADMRLGAQELDANNKTQTTTSKKRVSGFELGFGVDFAVHSNILIGAEFTHCHYQSMKVETFQDDGVPMTSYKIQPQTNAVGLRLTWKI